VVRRLFANKFALAALVIAALGAQYGLAVLSHPVAVAASSESASPHVAPVTTAVRACPSPGSPGGAGVALIAAAPGASRSGLAGGGAAVVTRLSAAGSASPGNALITRTVPDVLTRAKITMAPAASGRSPRNQQAAGGKVIAGPSRGGVVVQATGLMARALEVEQTSSGGLPTALCDGPGTDVWFVGDGEHAVASMQLYLMNTDSQPADAEVDIYTDTGPLLDSTDTGIAVPAHGLLVQSLASLVHGSRVVALHVRTSVGRLVAALRESKSAGEPGGWLPAAQPPARRLVIPGLPGSAGSRELYVAVPGGGNADVKLTAVTAKGSYHPTGGNGLELPGGSAVGVPLPSLSGVAAALQLTSNVPITAAVEVPGGAPGAPGAYTAAAAPIEEQGVIADNVSGSGDASTLILSAPRTAARVQIIEEGAAGGQQPGKAGQAPRVVAIAAQHTAAVRIRRPAGLAAGSPFAIVITPLAGSGPVYAGRVLTVDGTVKSIFPVLSALTTVPLPQVRDSPGALP